MPSSSVHLPHGLLAQLDALARRLGVSRNRVIVDACRRAVETDAGEWPPGFFDHSHYSREEREELEGAHDELMSIIEASRSSRSSGPFDA